MKIMEMGDLLQIVLKDEECQSVVERQNQNLELTGIYQMFETLDDTVSSDVDEERVKRERLEKLTRKAL